MSETIVIALGGNAIKKAGDSGSAEEQLKNVDATARQIALVLQAGYRVVLTHGNGPQVGSLLIQQEQGRDLVPDQPLHACGAMTQGHIGWMLQNRLRYHVHSLGIHAPVATVVTQVVVHTDDPDFQNPTKPVGPFYREDDARRLADEKGYIVRRVDPKSEKGWRRLVPSPQPKDILEKTAIRSLVAAGLVVIAVGGGGIPVAREDEHNYVGVDAVIDKDRAAVLLAEFVSADRFMILTDVPNVLINYGKPDESALETVHLDEIDRLTAEGHFLAGSMGPKVEAATQFARSTGRTATITSLENVLDGLNGSVGTHIVP